VLDEPTNDLDVESLELLEATLQQYPGTVLLVSHDRRFLDNVVTQTLVAEGGGIWKEFVGGYSDWLAQRAPAPAEPPLHSARERRSAGEADGLAGRLPAKLNYKETRELEGLPARIEALETEQGQISERMSRPDYHRLGAAQVREDGRRLEEVGQELAMAYDRWAELEARAAALKSRGPA